MSSFPSNLPDCVADFEDQRGIYEACVYGTCFIALILMGLPFRCCMSQNARDSLGRLQLDQLDAREQTQAKWACRNAVVWGSLGVIGFVLAVTRYFPQCNCTNGMSCDVCTATINGVPMGSCYMVATGVGCVFSLMFAACTLAFRRKLVALNGAATSYGTVQQEGPIAEMV